MGERKVPVLRTANSLIEDEFDSLRGRFEEEMRLMELEMERFKRQMMSRIGAGVKSSGPAGVERKEATKAATTATAASSTSKQCVTTKTATSTTKTTTTSGSRGSGAPKSGAPAAGAVSGCGGGNGGDALVSSPLIVDDDDSLQPGGKLLRLRFDLAAFAPEQIVVSTLDNRLQVSARREERAPNKRQVSEYNRDFLLPAGTDPNAIKSTLSADGVLTVEAPLPDALRAR